MLAAVLLQVGAMAKPTIYYFPIRGRAEVAKLCLSAKDVPFDVTPVDWAAMKADSAHYPFGQCPRYVDGDVDLVQSNAIIRHIARKYSLYGTTEKEHSLVDMVLDGIEDLRTKYVPLIYQDQLAAEKKVLYWKHHAAPEGLTLRNGGAHFQYLANMLKPSGFVVDSGVTAADLALFDIVDLHVRIFPEEMKATYPQLMAHYTKVSEIPGVKAYLASPLRLEKPNNSPLG